MGRVSACLHACVQQAISADVMTGFTDLWLRRLASCAETKSATNESVVLWCLCPCCIFSSRVSDWLDLNKYTTYNNSCPDFMFFLLEQMAIQPLSRKWKAKHHVVSPKMSCQQWLITADVWHFSNHSECYFGIEALSTKMLSYDHNWACRNLYWLSEWDFELWINPETSHTLIKIISV